LEAEIYRNAMPSTSLQGLRDDASDKQAFCLPAAALLRVTDKP